MLEHNNNSTEQDKASLEASASTTDARRSFLKKALGVQLACQVLCQAMFLIINIHVI